MTDNKQTYSVTNRSGGTVGYSIPDLNISRFFAVGETKRNISLEELEKLTYTRGGRRLLMHDLQLTKEGVEALEMDVEKEYFYTEDEIEELLINPMKNDEFLDALDFAPEGVVEVMKTLAVSLPITDMNKAEAIKKRTGFDVMAAIRHSKEFAEGASTTPETATKQRRVKDEEPATPARRVPDYKVVDNK